MPEREAWKAGGTMAGEVRSVLHYASLQSPPPVIAVSALRTDPFNTTDTLIKVAQALEMGDLEAALASVNQVEAVTHQILENDGWEMESGPQRIVTNMCADFRRELRNVLDSQGEIRGKGRAWHAFISKAEGERQVPISTFGEVMAREIYGAAMRDLGVKGSTVDLYDAGETLPALPDGIVVTGGNIRRHETTKGFSDVSGAELATHVGGPKAVRFFVIKDDPICTGDPRSDSSHKVVPSLSLQQAIAECSETGMAPGVVHPNGLKLLQDHAKNTGARIEVVVGSLRDSRRRTVISSDANANIQRAVAA